MSPAQSDVAALQAAAHHYLTDGRRLYRVVSPFHVAEDEPVAELEDCVTLEIRSYSARELLAMELRPVGGRATASAFSRRKAAP